MSIENKREMDTSRERNITVRLSDETVMRITHLCGLHGLTVGDFLENFIGELVNDIYDSDGRYCAGEQLQHCFALFPSSTLLTHLMGSEYSPEDYADCLEDVEDVKKSKQYYEEEHPGEHSGEVAASLEEERKVLEESLLRMRKDWISKTEPDLDGEEALVRKWVAEKRELLGED